MYKRGTMAVFQIKPPATVEEATTATPDNVTEITHSFKMENKTSAVYNPERDAFNKLVFEDKKTKDKQLVCYTWIYRWEAPTEFVLNIPKDNTLLLAKKDSTRQTGQADEISRKLS